MGDYRLVNRLKEVIEDKHMSPNAFALSIGVDPGNMRKKLSGKIGVTRTDITKLCDTYNVSRAWMERGEGGMYNAQALAEEKIVVADKDKRPYYDVDFSLGYDMMYNDQANVPDSYISLPGYDQADFWCRASGDSMKPKIENGNIIALREVADWHIYIPLNEVYAVVTRNQLRTVKVLRKGSDAKHFTLHAFNEEYPDQEIEMAAIERIYRVVGVVKTI